MPKSFASDNSSGVHPKIMAAIQLANDGDALAYGADPITAAAIAAFRREFSPDVQVFPVLNGTGANVLGIANVTRPFHAVICSDISHIAVDETGAPEKYTGCKLIPLPSQAGKIHCEQILPLLNAIGDIHHSQPKILSITQSTEYGTLYSLGEMRRFADLARSKGMYFHVDGARIANAAAALNVSFRELVVETGVDILSFGATKNGLLMGEAVLCFERVDTKDLPFLRKNALQLASKMRYISAQFVEYFRNELWRENAKHSNAMAKLLEMELKKIPQIQISQPVEANAVFAVVPRAIIEPLQKEFPFYVWNAARNEVRWMTSFNTSGQDVHDFVTAIRYLLH